jgi:hypothetical protein
MDLVAWPLAALALLLAAAVGSARVLHRARRDLQAEADRLPSLRHEIDGLRAELAVRRDTIGVRRLR